MCLICGSFICPPPCPGYTGESPERGRRVAFCNACGGGICEYDTLKFQYGKPYCLDCYIELEESVEQGIR